MKHTLNRPYLINYNTILIIYNDNSLYVTFKSFLSMINKNKISSNLLLLSVASMLALSALSMHISYTFSGEVFAHTDSSSDINTAGVDLQPNIAAGNIFDTKQ